MLTPTTRCFILLPGFAHYEERAEHGACTGRGIAPLFQSGIIGPRQCCAALGCIAAMKIPGIVVTTHCFISEPMTLDLAIISGIHQPECLVLEERDISEFDFCLLPDRPPGCETNRFRPISAIAQKEYSDDGGRHLYRLSELRAPVVSLLANLPADQIEPFCRRWSKHEAYSPFQGWEHVAPEVALQICQEKAFQKLHPFLLHFFSTLVSKGRH